MDTRRGNSHTPPQVWRRNSNRAVDNTANSSVDNGSSGTSNTNYLNTSEDLEIFTASSSYLSMDWKQRLDRRDGFPSSEATRPDTEQDLVVVRRLA